MTWNLLSISKGGAWKYVSGNGGPPLVHACEGGSRVRRQARTDAAPHPAARWMHHLPLCPAVPCLQPGTGLWIKVLATSQANATIQLCLEDQYASCRKRGVPRRCRTVGGNNCCSAASWLPRACRLPPPACYGAQGVMLWAAGASSPSPGLTCWHRVCSALQPLRTSRCRPPSTFGCRARVPICAWRSAPTAPFPPPVLRAPHAWWPKTAAPPPLPPTRGGWSRACSLTVSGSCSSRTWATATASPPTTAPPSRTVSGARAGGCTALIECCWVVAGVPAGRAGIQGALAGRCT